MVSREQKEVPGVTPRFLTLASPRREDTKFHCGPAATERTEARKQDMPESISRETRRLREKDRERERKVLWKPRF